MGLSASQARLLSITARISSNELQSQIIANSKMRLADKTQEASEIYIEALNSTKMVYSLYDSSGSASQIALTPSVLYEYGDLKNQYGIINSAGQIVVSSTDAKNFEDSNNLEEFLRKYDCEPVDNPMYELALQTLYGMDYEKFFGSDDLVDTNWDAKGWVDDLNSSMSSEEFTNWLEKLPSVTSTGGESGIYGSLVSALNSTPAYPVRFGKLADIYNGKACYEAVIGYYNGSDEYGQSSYDAIYHMEHNLCLLIWGIYGYDEDGDGTITNSDGTISVSRGNDWDTGNVTDYSITKNWTSGTDDALTAANTLMDELTSYSDDESIQEILQYLVDLYCDVANYLSANGGLGSDVSVTGTGTSSVKTEEELYEAWQSFYKMLEDVSDTDEGIESSWADIKSWAESVVAVYGEYCENLQNLPSDKIYDAADTKSCWYVNLWHRMNGESDTKSDEAYKNYKALEDNLLSSEAWLKFALENGVVTLEKVQYVSEAEDGTGLSNSQWTAVAYATCTDINTVEDEAAIAKAEAVYNKTLKEIEAKDTKYDSDIKKLDTEHNALQTEYDSVKTVIDNNVDRSFKAFS